MKTRTKKPATLDPVTAMLLTDRARLAEAADKPSSPLREEAARARLDAFDLRHPEIARMR